MRRIVFAAIVLIGMVVPQDALAACGHEGVSVQGTDEEAADACRALDDVLQYFKRMGMQPVPVVRISFQDQVYIDMFAHSYEQTDRESVGRNRVSGYFDYSRKELQVTSGRRGVQRDRRPWGIEWGPPIAYSILQHELVHVIVASQLGGEYQKFAKAWLEFIAYAVQFSIMDAGLKREVLAHYPDARPFQFPENVNPIVYAADPDEFGVSAHLFAGANGGAGFIAQILAKQVPFSTQEFEFLWVQ